MHQTSASPERADLCRFASDAEPVSVASRRRGEVVGADIDRHLAAGQHLGVKTITAIVIMLFAASLGATVIRATITPQELASAINEADALLVLYRTRTISPKDIQVMRCIARDEEPTEFQCKWRQRINGGWVKRTTWVAMDGKGWHVMDA